jgi:hypothetical protein
MEGSDYVLWEFGETPLTLVVLKMTFLSCCRPHTSTSRLTSLSAPFPSGLLHFALLIDEHQALDYDAYDALPHHIFRQVHRNTLDFSTLCVSSLPSYPIRPIPCVPLREPLLGAVRGDSPCPEPRCHCQSTQRGCPRGVEHGVSQGVPCSLMEVVLYCHTDLTPPCFFFFPFVFVSFLFFQE